MNHATTELFIDDLEVPVSALVYEEGKGFRYLLDGLNAERILIAAECIGDGRRFVDRDAHASERVVFERPIGKNQRAVSDRAHVNVEAADLMRIKAAELFDRGEPCGAEANMAKLLAADASWEAANVAVQTHGGFRLRRGLRHRTQVPRDAALPGRAGVVELLIPSHACRACSRTAQRGR